MVDVSVIILSFNNSRLVEDCVTSIKGQASRTSTEILLVDNGSPDAVVREIEAKCPGVEIIRNAKNLGFAEGNNVGIERASGRYCLILNQDTIIVDDAIGKLTEFGDRHQEAGIVGCKMLNADGTLQRSCRSFPTRMQMTVSALGLHRVFPKSRLFGKELLTFWDGDSERSVDWITGCAMLVRTDILKKLGGFDPQFFYHFEEVDLCKRVKGEGWQVLYTPLPNIIHLGGQSSKAEPTRFFLEKDRNCLRYFYKHGGLNAARWAKGLLACRYLIRLCAGWLGWAATLGSETRLSRMGEQHWAAFRQAMGLRLRVAEGGKRLLLPTFEDAERRPR